MGISPLTLGSYSVPFSVSSATNVLVVPSKVERVDQEGMQAPLCHANSQGVRSLSGELAGVNSKNLKEIGNSQAPDRSGPSYSQECPEAKHRSLGTFRMEAGSAGFTHLTFMPWGWTAPE